MIGRGIGRMLRAPWPQRWVADTVALAMATAILPRVAERVNLHSAAGFALVLVTTTAALLAAHWAMIPPPASKRPRPLASANN